MSEPTRVWVTGANGQVGRALLQASPAEIEVRGTTHADLDIGDGEQVATFLADFKPQLIINAAAYTAVDKAESEPALANQVNADGPANLASGALKHGDVRLLHISTDFVFDGCGSSPYRPTDPTAPLGVYGASKLAGEQAVLNTLGASATIVRTAWVYAAQGQNFVRTMLRLMNERGAVRVVADQVGTPTSAQSLAAVLWQFASRPDLSGVFHWTDAGVASWYDFAVAIAEEAAMRGVLKRDVQLTPIATADYPTLAKRPAYSVLDKATTIAALGMPPIHWRAKLREVLEELVVA